MIDLLVIESQSSSVGHERLAIDLLVQHSNLQAATICNSVLLVQSFLILR